MYTVQNVLLIAGVKFSIFTRSAAGAVFLTGANQLVGTYAALRAYRASKRAYKGWQVHHVLEYDDLHRLGVQLSAPPYEEQFCVLIPKQAHVGRINSILRRENPTRYQASRNELRKAYLEAYAMIGDYCGGGEATVRKELMGIIDAQFQILGVN